MRKQIALFISAVMIFTLLFTACGPSTTQLSEKTSSGITITDLTGAVYTFDKPLEHVIVQWSCAGGPFMTMSALLGNDVYKYLAGIDNTPQDYRADMWAQYTAAVPGLLEVPMIGSIDEEFNLEAVIASDAQAAILPLGMQSVAAESVQSKLEAAGIPVIYVDYHAETIENHTKSTELLGKLFGKEARAQEIIKFYREHTDAIVERVDEILQNQERPNIYIEVGMNGPAECGNTFDNSYSWGGIAYASGGNSIGEGIVENSSKMDPEYLLTANPEKVIFTGSYWPSKPESIRMGFDSNEEDTRKLVEAYFNRAGWNELDAVKNGEIYVIHHGLGREMYDCACFEFFAKTCFPEEFSDLNPTATLKEYYSKFLPYEFSGNWFMEY